MFICKSVVAFQKKVEGSTGNEYTVQFGGCVEEDVTFDWTCTCPQNRIKHAQCKHIKQVKPSWCGWNVELDSLLKPEYSIDGEAQCPKCDGEVVT